MNSKHQTFSIAKKHVHFADSHTVVEYVCHRKELTKVEKHQLWWRPSDFEAIMNEALENAFETRKHRHILCDGLDQALQRARRMAHIVQADNKCSNNSDGQPSPFYNMHDYLSEVLEADLGLRVWSEYGPTRRGLERLGASSQAHQHARDKVVRKSVSKVVAFTQKLREMKSQEKELDLPHDDKEDNECDLVRRVAEHMSRSSVIFARMMGLADAHAAGKLQQKETPEPGLTSPKLCDTSKVRPVKKLPSRESLLKSGQYQARQQTSSHHANVNNNVRC